MLVLIPNIGDKDADKRTYSLNINQVSIRRLLKFQMIKSDIETI